MINCMRCGTTAGEEVSSMRGIIITFFVSVGAEVLGYYICKWLDGDD